MIQLRLPCPLCLPCPLQQEERAALVGHAAGGLEQAQQAQHTISLLEAEVAALRQAVAEEQNLRQRLQEAQHAQQGQQGQPAGHGGGMHPAVSESDLQALHGSLQLMQHELVGREEQAQALAGKAQQLEAQLEAAAAARAAAEAGAERAERELRDSQSTVQELLAALEQKVSLGQLPWVSCLVGGLGELLLKAWGALPQWEMPSWEGPSVCKLASTQAASQTGWRR